MKTLTNTELAEKFAGTVPSFRDQMTQIAEDNAKPVLLVYSWWRQYAEDCTNFDQSPVMSEFLQWYHARLSLFIGTRPTGLSYCDMSREVDGDYVRLAFLPFSSLVLEWQPRVDQTFREIIQEDADRLAARRGEHYQVSASGQTVLLGESQTAR